MMQVSGTPPTPPVPPQTPPPPAPARPAAPAAPARPAPITSTYVSTADITRVESARTNPVAEGVSFQPRTAGTGNSEEATNSEQETSSGAPLRSRARGAFLEAFGTGASATNSGGTSSSQRVGVSAGGAYISEEISAADDSYTGVTVAGAATLQSSSTDAATDTSEDSYTVRAGASYVNAETEGGLSATGAGTRLRGTLAELQRQIP